MSTTCQCPTIFVVGDRVNDRMQCFESTFFDDRRTLVGIEANEVLALGVFNQS